MATGKARKSTHRKAPSKVNRAVSKSSRKSPVKSPSSSKKVVEVDPNKTYTIKEIGPIHLSWGKKRTKNEKGKIVKEWYIKGVKKHRMWVKWADKFADSMEYQSERRGKDKWEAGQTEWSAEEQADLAINEQNKQDIKKALEDKIIWPWIQDTDEDADARKKLLRKEGYKEWKGTTSEEKGKKWNIKFAIDPETDRSSDKSDSDTDSTSNTDKDDEEEDDEV